MKRASLLRALAAIPFLGALAPALTEDAAPAAPEEEVASLAYSFGARIDAVRLIWTKPFPGVPTAVELTKAAAQGFDRFVVLRDGLIAFQSPIAVAP